MNHMALGCVAISISALTDNKNKAAQEIKHILSMNGTDGRLARQRCMGFQKDT